MLHRAQSCMACMLQRIRLLLFRLCLIQQGGLVLLLCCVCTNGTTVGRAVVLLVLVCRSLCRVRLVCVSCSRASLALTRRLRALSSVVVGCVCCRVHVGAFFCLLTVCHLQVNRCVNAPPSGLPIPDPYCITSVCLLIAQSHCPNHFVLHDSRRDRLPRFPCLPPTSCDRGTRVLLANCLLSGIAQSVENVLHVTWLPHSCMTARQLTCV